MTKELTQTATDAQTELAIEYETDPIEIRDPVAETLGVLDPGAPFTITYADVVKAAGHSCPTAAGSYRIAQVGLDALYPDSLPVRSDVEVIAGGPAHDSTYGVMSRLISYVTGAAGVDGFEGLGDGVGDRQNLLSMDGFEPEAAAPTFRFRRLDTEETVTVSYHIEDVPKPGPAVGNLPAILDGTASDAEREAFAEAWHSRVQTVLTDESLFSVRNLD